MRNSSAERQKKWRQKNKIRYCYNNLKSNSKRRGKEFNLTLEQFADFCYECDYMAGKGRNKLSYHVDRIDCTKGYAVDNIQVKLNRDNAVKGNREKKILHYDYQTKTATVTKQTFNFTDSPFL